ncbi:MAG: aminopeptidase [archaeon]
MPLDLRTRKLAKLAVNYAVYVKPGEQVIISGEPEAIPFITELYKEIILRKAHPIVKIGLPNVADFFYKYASKEQIEHFPQHLMDLVKYADKYIGINTETNPHELSLANPKKIMIRHKITAPISDYICNNKSEIKRCTIAYPCIALALNAEMSFSDYENFVYNACLQDWKKICKFMNKVLNEFKKGKKVHLIGENVDLKFKINGKDAKSDIDGDNVPMGEVFMAPIRESMEGWIKFEHPITNAAKEIHDVSLKFENGKVIEFDASKNKDLLKEILETDENSSYIGEFGIGLNKKVTKFTKNLLFDEKIAGTIHLALGSAYKENGGGNDSAVHIDIVKDMRKAKIILDGKIIQENGKWKI